MGPHHQQAALEETYHRVREVAEVPLLLVDPKLPVVVRAPQQLRRPLLVNHSVKPSKRPVIGARRHPVEELVGPARRQLDANADRGVGGSVVDRIARQLAVLGIAPAPLELGPLSPAGVVLNSADSAARMDREPVRALVVHHCPKLRVIVGGVPHLRPGDPEIVIEEDAGLPLPVAEIPDGDVSHEHRLVEIDRVVEGQLDSHWLVPRDDIGDEGSLAVVPSDLPLGACSSLARRSRIAAPRSGVPRAKPGEPILAPDSHSKGMAVRMVLPSQMRVVDVADAVVTVEVDKQRTVPHRQIPGHAPPPLLVSAHPDDVRNSSGGHPSCRHPQPVAAGICRSSTAARRTSATLQACAMHPRGRCGGSPSKISAIWLSPPSRR